MCNQFPLLLISNLDQLPNKLAAPNSLFVVSEIEVITKPYVVRANKSLVQ